MADSNPGSEEKLTERQLEWGIWWVEHKKQVKAVISVVLGAIGFSLFAYGVWGFADWFIGSGVKERAQIGLLTQNLTDYPAFRAAFQPEPLVTQSPMVLTSGEGRYDIIAKVSNPNNRWWVEVTYHFSGSRMNDQEHTSHILPADTRYLYVLGIDAERKPTASLEILSVDWHRVDGHEVRPDYPTWSSKRLNFDIQNPEFEPPDPNAPIPVSRASFTVENDTAFSYNTVPFFVTLMSGRRIVGVNRVVATRLLSGQEREIEASWFHDLPSITQVRVQPELNIFDEEVYLEPGE